MERLRHVLKSQQFVSNELLDHLFDRATWYKKRVLDRDYAAVKLPGRLMAYNWFAEESTRTRVSFETAEANLGFQFSTTVNAKKFSSELKGENLPSTVKILSGYDPDLIVIRYNFVGAAELAASFTEVPIVNAGDSCGQHPTQALLDVYTIREQRGYLQEMKVVIGGDLKYGRVVRSLAYLLAEHYDPHIVFVAPEPFRIERDITTHLTEVGCKWSETSDVADAVHDADVIYWTRLQSERLPEGVQEEYLASGVGQNYRITTDIMNIAKPSAMLMHPLPMNDEIDEAVLTDPRTTFYRQAENGLYVRMALIAHLLGH